MTAYDVVVVGGGPVGAVAARHAAEVGARVLLIEQGECTGEPARCTGLVSPPTLDLLGVSTASLLREIRGGILHAPGGRRSSFVPMPSKRSCWTAGSSTVN